MFRLNLFSTVALIGALVTLTPSESRAFDAQACPKFSQIAASASAEALAFHGVAFPGGQTNYPIIDAGLYVLRHFKSEQFLLDALDLVCVKGDVRVDCETPTAQGLFKDSTDVLQLWTQRGATARQVDACRDYVRLSASLAEALLPGGVALQSNPYSSEGISLRLSFWRQLQLRPTLEAACRSVLPVANCARLGQLLDDMKFAELLADKLSVDGKTAKALQLLAIVKSDVAALDMAAATPTSERFNTLLGSNWDNLRAAIQQAL